MKHNIWNRTHRIHICSPRAGERAHVYNWHRSSRPHHQAETSGELAGEEAPHSDDSEIRTRADSSQPGEEEHSHVVPLLDSATHKKWRYPICLDLISWPLKIDRISKNDLFLTFINTSNRSKIFCVHSQIQLLHRQNNLSSQINFLGTVTNTCLY